MKSTTQDILDELYQFSPELKYQEDAIVRIIQKMQENRPTIEMDEVFRSELKSRLMREFASQQSIDTSDIPLVRSWFSRSWLYGFGSACAVGIAGFLVAIPLLGLFQKDTIPPQNKAFGGSYGTQRTSDSSPGFESTAMMTQNMTADMDPYIQYVYTGTLEGLLTHLPSYKQLYPKGSPKIGGYELYDFTTPMTYIGVDTDPNLLEKVDQKMLSREILLEKMRTAENPYLPAPTEGQKVLDVSLHHPRIVYQRVPVVDPDTNTTTSYYLPAIAFLVGEHRSPYQLPSEVVVPFVEIPQK